MIIAGIHFGSDWNGDALFSPIGTVEDDQGDLGFCRYEAVTASC